MPKLFYKCAVLALTTAFAALCATAAKFHHRIRNKNPKGLSRGLSLKFPNRSDTIQRPISLRWDERMRWTRKPCCEFFPSSGCGNGRSSRW